METFGKSKNNSITSQNHLNARDLINTGSLARKSKSSNGYLEKNHFSGTVADKENNIM